MIPHLNDAMIDEALSAEAVQQTLREAFVQFAHGEAAMQTRMRTQAGGVKLSTLGAVIPGQDVAGAKVYTTLSGRFTFVILLFSARDGRPLATLDAGALTRKRTAACSVLAAQAMAPAEARVLGLFGAGTQGCEHARQLARAFALESILINDPYAPADLPERLASETGVSVRQASPREVAGQADILVTASRSETPVFEGDCLRPGAFVAAIGSSLPHTRELDDRALARAHRIVVEWREQTLHEAGDIRLAAPGLITDEKLLELPQVLAGQTPARSHPEDILIYKSVGVGLEDIAVAGLAYGLIAQARGLPPA